MTRNQLKCIACVAMLIDHIGYVLLPELELLRIIGRIAMPIFAFFIGEGCIYTKSRVKYFLRVFVLGLLCQLVYILEGLISGSGNGLYFNILLTFSLSIILCSALLYFKKCFGAKGRERLLGGAVFILALLFIAGVELFCKSSTELIGASVTFDYGLFGILLPCFAALSERKTPKLILFSASLCVLGGLFYNIGIMYLSALMSLPLLLLYNGKAGKANLKYFFYAFYPCHLALIYLLSFII